MYIHIHIYMSRAICQWGLAAPSAITNLGRPGLDVASPGKGKMAQWLPMVSMALWLTCAYWLYDSMDLWCSYVYERNNYCRLCMSVCLCGSIVYPPAAAKSLLAGPHAGVSLSLYALRGEERREARTQGKDSNGSGALGIPVNPGSHQLHRKLRQASFAMRPFAPSSRHTIPFEALKPRWREPQW